MSLTTPRRIIIRLENGPSATARLLSEQAPATTDAIWELLAEPLVVKGIHAMWTGPEISLQVPPERAHDALAHLPPENQTIFPQPGDLVWAYLPPYAFGGMPDPVYDIGLFYGPHGRIFLPVGWVPANRFASLDGDFSEFADTCRQLRLAGAREVTLARLT